VRAHPSARLSGALADDPNQMLFQQSGALRPMYAIIKTGGKQYRVAEGDVIEVEKVDGEPGSSLTLPALMTVDGEDLVIDAAALAAVSVQAEVVAHTKGPKIVIHKFKNKTGYHKRQGHRQPLTKLRVTAITVGTAAK